MKRICLWVWLSLFPVWMMGQGVLVPDLDIVKVGEIQFQTPKTVTFGFTNKGNSTLRISSVKTACGCTTLESADMEVKAGKHGEIVVTYDAGIMGSFYKEIEVYVEDLETPIYLAMQGHVVREVKDYSMEFPVDLGNVRLNTNQVDFGDVCLGDSVVAEIKIVNAEHAAYKPELMHLPSFVRAQAIPENVASGKTGIIRLILNGAQMESLGEWQTKVYLSRYLGDKVCPENEINLKGVVLPDFSAMSEEERISAAAANASSEVIVLGQDDNSNTSKSRIKKIFGRRSNKWMGSLFIGNTGGSPLNILQLQVFSSSLNVSVDNRTVMPGKSVKVKVEKKHRTRKNTEEDERQEILLITNDPSCPKLRIKVDSEY